MRQRRLTSYVDVKRVFPGQIATGQLAKDVIEKPMPATVTAREPDPERSERRKAAEDLDLGLRTSNTVRACAKQGTAW